MFLGTSVREVGTDSRGAKWSCGPFPQDFLKMGNKRKGHFCSSLLLLHWGFDKYRWKQFCSLTLLLHVFTFSASQQDMGFNPQACTMKDKFNILWLVPILSQTNRSDFFAPPYLAPWKLRMSNFLAIFSFFFFFGRRCQKNYSISISLINN